MPGRAFRHGSPMDCLLGGDMEITEIRVIPRNDARLKGYVSITFAGCFALRGVKIILGKAGRLFVAMPARKKPDGTFQDIAHPITPEFRIALETAILDEYHRVLADGPVVGHDELEYPVGEPPPGF